MIPRLELEEMEELRLLIKKEWDNYSITQINMMGMAFQGRLRDLARRDMEFILKIPGVKEILKILGIKRKNDANL